MSEAAQFYAENQQAFIYTHLGVQALVIVIAYNLTTYMRYSGLGNVENPWVQLLSRIFFLVASMYLIVVLAMEIVLSVQGRPACPPCAPCVPDCSKCAPTAEQIAEVCVLTPPSLSRTTPVLAPTTVAPTATTNTPAVVTTPTTVADVL